MPKLAKSTKTARDVGVIRGVQKLFATRKTLIIDNVTYTPESLAAIYAEHLQAMVRVHELTIERGVAIARERQLEARVARIQLGVKAVAVSMVGKHSPRLRAFGIQPDKKPYMTAEAKKRANDKRQQTRERLGMVGKRRRARRERGGGTG